MLPGFRFLFAAILLSVSILVFGLGAAALLRAAHEEVASNPGWHAAPDATFAQQAEVARPVLAMLRVDPPAVQPKAPDDVAAVASPEQVTAPASTEQVPEVPVPAERAAMVAALEPEETSEPVAAKPEIPALQSPAPGEAANTDAAANHTRFASAEQGLPPASEASPVAPERTPPAASEQTPAPVSPQAGIASTKIAALGDPAATEPQPRANTASAKPDRSIIRKRQQARRAAQRRRMALLRARQAQLAMQQQQQAGDLFSQPQPLVQPPLAARKH